MRPLHEAALGGWTEIVEEFLETGATVYALDMSRQTALHHACRSSNSCIDLLKVLLHHGADREAEDDQGQLPLHLAAKKGNPAMVLSLVENIEDSICKEDKYGKTALHNAARAGN
ncbi:palmitoyltransferase, partial [Cenococcum geophilum 1.58]|uniref:palmitoyltransferase n=1 Tax=Cenococcum geophilum 1.58 TaxID=794803 RepID=UPI00358F9EEB